MCHSIPVARILQQSIPNHSCEELAPSVFLAGPDAKQTEGVVRFSAYGERARGKEGLRGSSGVGSLSPGKAGKT
jgi:hypothetical protein